MPKTLKTLTATTTPALNSKMLIRRSGQTSDESVLVSYLKTLVNTSVAVSGGTIDGATIGGTTPAAATVTDLTATGTTTLGVGTGVAKLASGVVSAGSVDLTSEVTGALPVANGGTGSTTAGGARTNLGLGSAAVEDTSAFLQPANNLSDVALASTARTNLGLGSIATQDAASVSITGGSITGITDLAVADGGTGAGTAAGARTNLGLVIGTDVQAQNANLQGIADQTVGTNELVYKDGGSAWATTALTAFGRSLLDDNNAATARGTLGLGDMAEQTSSSVAITGGSITGITDLAVADGGTGASTAGGARTNLGLGTIATQDATSVSISGGSITGISDLAVADGGTGASTAADARTNLGLGSIATQDAASVSITGGSITGITDLAVADGGTGVSSITANALVVGAGSSAIQTVSGLGTSGQVLTSNGAGSKPTWQDSAGGLTRGTAQNTTSGTSIDFTSIPAGVNRITVMLNAVSTNGSSLPIIQLGDGGGFETTGYSSSNTVLAASTLSTSTSTVGFLLDAGSGGAARERSGNALLCRLDGNTWTMSYSGRMGSETNNAGGVKTLSAELTQIRLTTVGGSDTFDNGTINIMYE